MSNPTIPQLPTPPSRSMGQSEFSDSADAFLSALPDFGESQNELSDWMNSLGTELSEKEDNLISLAEVSLSSSNFKGDWSTLTGSLSIPSSVYHDGSFWMLLSNTGAVQGIEPGVSPSWTKITLSSKYILSNINITKLLNARTKVLTHYGDDRLSGSLSVVRASSLNYKDDYGYLSSVASNTLPETKEGFYINTSYTNRLLYSNDQTNDFWLKGGLTITGNVTDAPNQTITADKIVEDTSTGAHLLRFVEDYVAGNYYTYSVFFKQAENRYISIQSRSEVFGQISQVTVDLQEGNYNVVTGSFYGVELDEWADGWYRLSITQLATTTLSSTFNAFWIRLTKDLITANPSYTGDGSSGVYIAMAQLTSRSYVDPYVETSASQVTVPGTTVTFPGLNNILTKELSLYFEIDYVGENGTSSIPDILKVGPTSNLRVEYDKSNNKLYFGGDSIGTLQSKNGLELSGKWLITYSETGAYIFKDGESVLQNDGISSLDFSYDHTIQILQTMDAWIKNIYLFDKSLTPYDGMVLTGGDL